MAEREHQAQMMDKTVQTALDMIVRLLARTAAHEIQFRIQRIEAQQ